MATYFTIDPLDGNRHRGHEGQYESLYAAIKATEHIAEVNEPPSEVVAHGNISKLWEIEIEQGIALWQGYQFEPCDGFYDHIEECHDGDYDLTDIDHAEAGLVRGINGAVIATYAACRTCDLLKIRLIAPTWSDRIDFVSDART